MKVYAIVFFDPLVKIPFSHKIYSEYSTRYERHFIREFVEFGRKEFIKHMDTTEKEFVIEIGNGSFLIYVTIVDDIGVAMLLSSTLELDTTPHTVSKKLILDYKRLNYIPDSEEEIMAFFKISQIKSDIDDSKKVLLRSISKVIERGENIEDLVNKTQTLSVQSKLFFKSSRKFNSCCWIFPTPRWKK